MAFTRAPFRSESNRGSEGGWIIEDEEIPGACHITLEEDCIIAPYGMTCSVDGLLMHTTWGDYQEAMEKYAGMKNDLRKCALTLDDEGFDGAAWCHEFVSQWL